MRKSSWVLSGAYALLALAVATTALAFAILRAWDSPVISGAAPGYQYLALGYQRPTGPDFSSISTVSMAQMQLLLPVGYGIASSMQQQIGITTQPGTHPQVTRIELVMADYAQALHLRPIAGRLLTPADAC